jgi:hypothetical protein
MNNPGIDLEIWKQLNKKWTDLDSRGHKVKVEFRLISDPKDEHNILAIDVVQTIDDEIVVETVQRNVGEAYATLGIDELSSEQLELAFKDLAHPLWLEAKEKDAILIVTMTPTSPASGEIRGVLERSNSVVKCNVAVNYQHYYALNALREKMFERTGKSWSKVTAVYKAEDAVFHFDY